MINIIKIATLNVDPKVTDITLNSMIFVINIVITNLAISNDLVANIH